MASRTEIVSVARPSRLRVLQAQPAETTQNCSQCQSIKNCWKPGVSDRHIITNLLICRIKRGINVNQSTKLLLELLKPKLIKLTGEVIAATGATGLDRETIMADIQSEVINQLMHHYVISETGYALYYLFGRPKGVILRAVTKMIVDARKFNSTYVSENVLGSLTQTEFENFDFGREPPTSLEDAYAVHETRSVAARIEAVIDDGITLRLPEYRVLRFCLDNASEAKRPLNGLHIYLSRVMNVVRSRITRIFAEAREHVRERTENEL